MTFFIDQHGCAKNQVDGELLTGILLNSGWEQAKEPLDPDLIIINSCGFIESAKKEALDSVFAVRSQYPNSKIILAGCLAQRYAEKIKDQLPEVDAFFGNGDLSLLPTLLEQLFDNKNPLKTTEKTNVSENSPVLVPEDKGVCCGVRPLLSTFPGSAFVKVTEGCDNCCSFCAIPLIRGHLRSRTIQEIIDEAKTLFARGVKEINLIGQDLASYGVDLNDSKECIEQTKKTPRGKSARHDGKTLLPELLKEFSKLKETFILRLLYIHPDHFPEEILPIMASDERILPYFDIPFQHGSAQILKAMNRKGNSETYISLVNTIRQHLPNAVLRTTFLTGFPGETAKNQKESVAFLKAIRPLWSGAFSYSLEDDTPIANKLEVDTLKTIAQVSEKTAVSRKKELEEIQQKITESTLLSFVGQVLNVLIEELIPEEDGLALGRAWFQAPDVDGAVVLSSDYPELLIPGEFVKAKIIAVHGVDLEASVIK